MLQPDEVHLWLTSPEDIRDPDLIREYHALLDDDDRQKCSRYRVPQRRHECLVGRALLRTTLSRYCPAVRPSGWHFVEVENGRPEIAPGLAPVPLRFNLSRTDAVVACAVTLQRAIGVDVETVAANRNVAAIAARCFTPAERADIDPGDLDRFYQYWTLKESYVKARGLGLLLPLNQIAFSLDGDHRHRVQFGPDINDNPARWHFVLERPSPQHILAVAVERHQEHEIRIQLQCVVPLR